MVVHEALQILVDQSVEASLGFAPLADGPDQLSPTSEPMWLATASAVAPAATHGDALLWGVGFGVSALPPWAEASAFRAYLPAVQAEIVEPYGTHNKLRCPIQRTVRLRVPMTGLTLSGAIERLTGTQQAMLAALRQLSPIFRNPVRAWGTTTQSVALRHASMAVRRAALAARPSSSAAADSVRPREAVLLSTGRLAEESRGGRRSSAAVPSSSSSAQPTPSSSSSAAAASATARNVAMALMASSVTVPALEVMLRESVESARNMLQLRESPFPDDPPVPLPSRALPDFAGLTAGPLTSLLPTPPHPVTAAGGDLTRAAPMHDAVVAAAWAAAIAAAGAARHAAVRDALTAAAAARRTGDGQRAVAIQRRVAAATARAAGRAALAAISVAPVDASMSSTNSTSAVVAVPPRPSWLDARATIIAKDGWPPGARDAEEAARALGLALSLVLPPPPQDEIRHESFALEDVHDDSSQHDMSMQTPGRGGSASKTLPKASPLSVEPPEDSDADEATWMLCSATRTLDRLVRVGSQASGDDQDEEDEAANESEVASPSPPVTSSTSPDAAIDAALHSSVAAIQSLVPGCSEAQRSVLRAVMNTLELARASTRSVLQSSESNAQALLETNGYLLGRLLEQQQAHG